MHGRIFLDKDKKLPALRIHRIVFERITRIHRNGFKGTICDVEECGFGSMISFALHRVHGFIS